MTASAPAQRRAFTRTSGTPLWAQIRHDLRKRLVDGEFVDGFPSDRELVSEYGVSRHTVREALREFQDEGMLLRQRGRGTFVTPLALVQPVGPLYSLFRSIEDQGYRQDSDVIAIERTTNATVAQRLDCDSSTELFHLRRVRRADDTPFAIDNVWMPADIVAPLFVVDFRHTALYAELERHTGLRPTSGWERIHPGIPDAECRALLDIVESQAVFVLERFTSHNQKPLEWRETIIRGDAYTFLTNWNATQTSSQFTTSKRK